MRKQHPASEKAQIILEVLKEDQSISQIASEHHVHPNQISQWKGQVLDGLPSLFEPAGRATRALEAAHQQQIAELHQKIGELTTQLDWLKKKSGLDPAQGGPGRLG